jgi:hypothetical protein
MMLDVCSFLNTSKHRSKKWNFYGIFYEERCGGVAAIEQPR